MVKYYILAEFCHRPITLTTMCIQCHGFCSVKPGLTMDLEYLACEPDHRFLAWSIMLNFRFSLDFYFSKPRIPQISVGLWMGR